MGRGLIGRKFHQPPGLWLGLVPAADMAYSTVVCPSPCSPIWTWTIYSSIPLFLCLQWSCLLQLHCQAHDPQWPNSQKHVVWCNWRGSLVLLTQLLCLSADLWDLLKLCCSLFNPLHAFCHLHMSMQKLDSHLKKDKGEFILEPSMIDHRPGTQTFISSNLIFQNGSSLMKLFIIKGQKKS